jgi:hypothetical protein
MPYFSKKRKDEMGDTIKEAFEPVVTGTSGFSMQVCVPKDWGNQQIIAFAEKENPCGTTNGWLIRKEGDNALKGMPERNQCSERGGFVHVMLDV